MEDSMFEDTQVQEVVRHYRRADVDYSEYFQDADYEGPQDNGFIDIFHANVSNGFHAFSEKEVACILQYKCHNILGYIASLKSDSI